MYPVSEAYKNAIAQNNRNVRIMGTITLRDNTVINISDEDILQGSLYFTEQCVSGEDIEIGNVYASEMGLTLTSPPENPYSLDGARIILNFGIETSEGVWEYVPLGYFYVTEIERKATVVNLKALDGMILFDVPMDGVLTAGTPYALIDSCCTKAGITLATGMEEFQGFANGLTAFTIPSDSKIETCRDLLMWVCQLTGTFARMNRMGQLEIIPITMGPSVKTISKQERFTSDVSDFYVKVTKVAMKIGETEYSQGTTGMTLTLEENPLLAGKSEAEINAALAEILSQVTEAEYTPYNLTCAGDPALQAGDWVKLTGVSNINGPEFVYTRNSVAYHPDTGEEIPEDTPVFVDFAGGKKGSLMVEGTTNLLGSDGSFETDSNSDGVADGWSFTGYGSTASLSSDALFGTKSQRITSTAGDANSARRVQKTITITGGKTYTFSAYAKTDGVTPAYLRIDTNGNTPVTLHSPRTTATTWTKLQITFTAPADATSVYVRCYNGAPLGAVGWVQFDGAQLEEKPYATSFTDGTRAAPLKRITLPEPLPEEFGVGVATKMLHAHDAADRTFWECGGYRCYFDSADNKLKMTNGTATVELAVTWAANDIIGVYAGRQNGKLFLQAKIAGALTDRVEAEAGAGTGETLYVGSRADGSESVNAVVADMVFHDRPEDIDPVGYLAGVPGGGGE